MSITKNNVAVLNLNPNRDLNIAGRDVKTKNTSKTSKDEGIIGKVIKWLLVPLVLAGLVYLLNKLTGINLADFGL